MSNHSIRNRRRAFCKLAKLNIAFKQTIEGRHLDARLLAADSLFTRDRVDPYSRGFVIPTERRGEQSSTSTGCSEVRMTRRSFPYAHLISDIPPFSAECIRQLQEGVRQRLDGMLLGEMLLARRRQEKEEKK